MACALLRPINPAVIIFLGVYTTLWGFWVASPLWDVFPRAELFGTLAVIAPEWAWGCLAMACGAVTIYGAVKRRYGSLVRGAFVSGWCWSMISIFYFIGDPLSTGGITALAFAVYAGFVYLNIRVNHKNNKNSDKILH